MIWTEYDKYHDTVLTASRDPPRARSPSVAVSPLTPQIAAPILTSSGRPVPSSSFAAPVAVVHPLEVTELAPALRAGLKRAGSIELIKTTVVLVRAT